MDVVGTRGWTTPDETTTGGDVVVPPADRRRRSPRGGGGGGNVNVGRRRVVRFGWSSSLVLAFSSLSSSTTTSSSYLCCRAAAALPPVRKNPRFTRHGGRDAVRAISSSFSSSRRDDGDGDHRSNRSNHNHNHNGSYYQDEDPSYSTTSRAAVVLREEEEETTTTAPTTATLLAAASSPGTRGRSMEDAAGTASLVGREKGPPEDAPKHHSHREDLVRGRGWSRWRRTLGNRGGDVISAWGFLSSSTSSLFTDHRPWKPTFDAIRAFFETTGIDAELSQSLNGRFFDHVIILSRIQRALLHGTDRRLLAQHHHASSSPLAGPMTTTTAAGGQQRSPAFRYGASEAAEALRYMRYATAVYGEAMIQATEFNEHLGAAASSSSSGLSSTGDDPSSSATTTTPGGSPRRQGRRSGGWSRGRVSRHVGIPAKDIVLEATSHHGDSDGLKHMVAVDHRHGKVILAIRGTYNLAELLADVAAFTRPFCAGEAHSEMSLMAERVWEAAGETVMDLLHKNEDYELILTGHSLGAGAACLLNILFHFDDRRMIDGRKVRCFAYATPPCFKPLEFCPGAMRACTTLIHENDFVPFVSVDSVRQLLSSVRALEDLHLPWGERVRLMTGMRRPDAAMLRAVQRSRQRPVPPKAGAPRLAIPSSRIVWLREDDETGRYDAVRCDPSKLSRLGLLLDANMLTDHMAGRYELALMNLDVGAEPEPRRGEER